MPDKANILLLEDYKPLLKVTCEFLELDDDYVAHGAASLAQAREILKTVEPDLAILDINVPDGSGLDFADELREHYPRTAIMFLTGRTEAKYYQAALEKGAQAYVLKPFDSKQMRSTIAKILSDAKNKREGTQAFA